MAALPLPQCRGASGKEGCGQAFVGVVAFFPAAGMGLLWCPGGAVGLVPDPVPAPGAVHDAVAHHTNGTSAPQLMGPHS